MDDVEAAVALDNYLDALWEDYIVTGEGQRLAAYISSGGDIDARARQEIARCLRGLIATAHGNKDVARDVEFYTHVKLEVSASRLATALNSAAPGGKRPTQKQAFELLGPAFGVSVRGAKAMYARGHEAFNDTFNTADTVADCSADAKTTQPSRSLHELLTEYEVGKDPAILAEYVEHGGDINKAMKATIIRELRGEEGKSRPHGSSDPYHDLQFSFEVAKHQADGASLDAAISESAAAFGLTESGARERYRRGRRIGLSRRDSGHPI